MNRTETYLAGRFQDYYRKADLTLPPEADSREWGFIPWTSGNGVRMVRHKSLAELGDLNSFTSNKKVKHFYFSSSKYERPGDGSMEDKDWQGADLVFDLDADHLDGVDPADTSYREMLSECKSEVEILIDILKTDFGFTDLTVVFSGGRGYHVHVRDEAVQSLSGQARSEIVDYVTGNQASLDSVTTNTSGEEESDILRRKRVMPRAGIPSRIYNNYKETVEQFFAKSDSDQISTLAEVLPDRVDETEIAQSLRKEEKTVIANALVGVIDERAIQGVNNVVAKKLVDHWAQKSMANATAGVDEPVTRDVNRLIRFPGSLHGGTGFEVTRLSPTELSNFVPTRDGAPDTFRSNTVRIELTENVDMELCGTDISGDTGTELSVIEGAAIFLMARGKASKLRE